MGDDEGVLRGQFGKGEPYLDPALHAQGGVPRNEQLGSRTMLHDELIKKLALQNDELSNTVNRLKRRVDVLPYPQSRTARLINGFVEGCMTAVIWLIIMWLLGFIVKG